MKNNTEECYFRHLKEHCRALGISPAPSFYFFNLPPLPSVIQPALPDAVCSQFSCQSYIVFNCWFSLTFYLSIQVDMGAVYDRPYHSKHCCCLVIKSCPTLRDPIDQSTPGPPVFHCLPELGQIHADSFDDTVQPSCPLSSPSPPAFTLSQHQGLFQEVFSSHEKAKLLEPQLQELSFQ